MSRSTARSPEETPVRQTMPLRAVAPMASTTSRPDPGGLDHDVDRADVGDLAGVVGPAEAARTSSGLGPSVTRSSTWTS